MEEEILEELKKLNQKLDLLINDSKAIRAANYCEHESVGFYLQRIFSLLNNYIISGSRYNRW